jgi:ubiquinone/menaquinone biosynthesis C-methylase UbiE
MYTQEEMLAQCPKPEGDIGRFAGLKMNERHLPLWQWGLSHIALRDDDTILDAGCGGGEAIRLLARRSAEATIHGIDHSGEMVRLSGETNRELIGMHRVRIREASISNLPFADGTFNMVTAFETYSFWPDIANDFKEVRRVLRPGGIFLLVHSAYRHESFEERNSYWSSFFKMKIHSLEEIGTLLAHAGFQSIEIFDDAEKNWFTAVAGKPFG